MNLIDEARDHLDVADRIGTTNTSTMYHLNLAQTKATLALAEQQRLANVIAWYDSPQYKLSPALVEEIERGLGLA